MKTFSVFALLVASVSAQAVDSPIVLDAPGPGYREQSARVVRPEMGKTVLPAPSRAPTVGVMSHTFISPASLSGPKTSPSDFDGSLPRENPFATPISFRMDNSMGVTGTVVVKVGSGALAPVQPTDTKSEKKGK